MMISTPFPLQFAPVSYDFIDQALAPAGGEFVKTYLMLLRLAPRAEISFGLLADQLNQTEKDVQRALKYWEKTGWLSLKEEEGTLKEIAFIYPASKGQETKAQSAQAQPAELQPAQAAGEKEETTEPKNYSAREMKRLMKQDDFSQLIFVVERYLGRPLNAMDTDLFAYLYDELKFPGETLEYLVEYCVDIWEKRGRKKDQSIIAYMNSVALSWHRAGATDLAAARQQVKLYGQQILSFRDVEKAFGLKTRNLTEDEQRLIAHWIFEKNLPQALMLEACRRTIRAKNAPDFNYLEGILKGWEKQGVKTMEDLDAADQKHQQEARQPAEAPKKKAGGHQPDTDYEEAMRQIFLDSIENAAE